MGCHRYRTYGCNESYLLRQVVLPFEKEEGRVQLVLLAASQDSCEVRPNLRTRARGNNKEAGVTIMYHTAGGWGGPRVDCCLTQVPLATGDIIPFALASRRKAKKKSVYKSHLTT